MNSLHHLKNNFQKMAKELTMVEISYDFDALNLDMESGNLKFNLTINQMVKDGLSQKELQGLNTALGKVSDYIAKSFSKTIDKLAKENAK